ncbi:DUF1810 domain-containing protein [Microvirga antarctica]|uniref:DUF1810 domain-containing protein n=1 Tax=Microvirga antarctica TaxID=2819233 RepID=UPI001B30F69F|nr:DUF1810 domain-containing protein [Microvirga antarctica]
MTPPDLFDLQRFVTAQSETFDRALAELEAGRKTTHWIWFVFPQLRDLGRSSMALFYGIGSLAEARAYLTHPVLAPRLMRVTQAVIDAPAPTLHALFGSPDDMKFRSSMTLFAMAADDEPIFQLALDRWCAGETDPRTLAIIASEREGQTPAPPAP